MVRFESLCGFDVLLHPLPFTLLFLSLIPKIHQENQLFHCETSSEHTGGFVLVSEDVPDLLMMKVLMGDLPINTFSSQRVERLLCCTSSAFVSV